ncbi:MAG TPA: 4'-phosphopantetheinyl transferase superfamily protein, partial [Saprospiraceae bacterium]|nr:4'-phosphopantetheinyl transferase superfamily protein [Saprospiraceae bacterium]
MAIRYQFEADPDTWVYIWHIEEPDAYFIEHMPWDPRQLAWLDSIHPAKKREYLASRFLIFKITGTLDSHLYKDESGKLLLVDSDKHISVSHSGDWTGIAVAEGPVGFDLQISSPKIQVIRSRFLSREEFEVLGQADREEHWINAWNAKEAVYKAHGKKGIHFAAQIRLDLQSSEKQSIRMTHAALILSHETRSYALFHGWLENFGWAIALDKGPVG